MNESLFRILAAAIFLTGITISLYFRRKADVESGERVSSKDEGAPMFIALRLGGLIIWLGAIAWLVNPAWFAWSKIGLPVWARWLGVGTGILSDLMIYWLFSSIGNSISPTVGTRTHHRLVRTGPYRFIRHPLYTVATGFFLSYALMTDNWLFAALVISAFILLALRVPNEEAHLIERFGDEYREYMQTTGAFLPRLKT